MTLSLCPAELWIEETDDCKESRHNSVVNDKQRDHERGCHDADTGNDQNDRSSLHFRVNPTFEAPKVGTKNQGCAVGPSLKFGTVKSDQGSTAN